MEIECEEYNGKIQSYQKPQEHQCEWGGWGGIDCNMRPEKLARAKPFRALWVMDFSVSRPLRNYSSILGEAVNEITLVF